MKLMIVDDHPATRKLIRQLLDGPGVTFCECASGDEAMLRAHDFQPDWVTMDIHMPGMGGIEATRRIRAAHPDVIVLLTSTYDFEDLPPDAADCGAAAYLHTEDLSPELLTRIWRTTH